MELYILSFKGKDMDISQKHLEKTLSSAINVLFIKDYYLLKNDVNERSITHKLGSYLQDIVGNEYDVDCEYNKNGASENFIKKIKASSGKCEINTEDCLLKVGKQREKCIYPDIIVHHRGSDNNILIIEVKKADNIESDKGIKYDKFKLEQYTGKDSSLNYQYGVLLILGIKNDLNKYKLIWYENGLETISDKFKYNRVDNKILQIIE